MKLKLPVNLAGVEDLKLQKFLEQIEFKLYLELDETDTDYTLTDSYIVHENDAMSELPLKIKKKEL